MGLRYDEIADIIKIIDGSSCDELIVETSEMKLVVRRNGAASAPALPGVRDEATVPRRGSAAPSPSAAPEAARAKTSMPAPGKAESAGSAVQIEVPAPMVGTFYRASAPDAAPFVEIGTLVEKGQPLCLIEVMKLFTTIYAEQAGRVVQIGAQNGELVEYGRTLFVLEPTS